jgi:hypothetical protein
VSADDIAALALRIKGTYDPHWVWMYLWRDDEDTELCPICHLLIYLFVSGICDGVLFPGHKELNVCANGILLNQETKTKLGYDTVSLSLQEAAKNVLKVRMSAVETNYPMTSGPCRLGCHTGRKSAYLLGIFGGGVLPALM